MNTLPENQRDLTRAERHRVQLAWIKIKRAYEEISDLPIPGIKEAIQVADSMIKAYDLLDQLLPDDNNFKKN